jgi:hypothetical protein
MCFVAYAYAVLLYVSKQCPEAEKVDFIVERNGETTKHIHEFHSHLARSLKNLKRPELEKLVGELIPAGKERIPTQAADVLCWHIGRHMSTDTTMDADDIKRYNILAHRKGTRIPIERIVVEEIQKSFSEHETKIGPSSV